MSEFTQIHSGSISNNWIFSVAKYAENFRNILKREMCSAKKIDRKVDKLKSLIRFEVSYQWRWSSTASILEFHVSLHDRLFRLTWRRLIRYEWNWILKRADYFMLWINVRLLEKFEFFTSGLWGIPRIFQNFFHFWKWILKMDLNNVPQDLVHQ